MEDKFSYIDSGYSRDGLVDVISGSKVAWLIYESKEQAQKSVPFAGAEAYRQASQGYDFGYQYPGAIEQEQNGKNKGLWSLCIA